MNIRGSNKACVTLQRPPPEMRTLERNCELRSKSETWQFPLARAAAIAAKKPAAPPPTITISVTRQFIDKIRTAFENRVFFRAKKMGRDSAVHSTTEKETATILSGWIIV